MNVQDLMKYFAVVHIDRDYVASTVRVWSEDCLDEVRRTIPSLKTGTRVRLMHKSDDYPAAYWEHVVE